MLRETPTRLAASAVVSSFSSASGMSITVEVPLVDSSLVVDMSDLVDLGDLCDPEVVPLPPEEPGHRTVVAGVVTLNGEKCTVVVTRYGFSRRESRVVLSLHGVRETTAVLTLDQADELVGAILKATATSTSP